MRYWIIITVMVVLLAGCGVSPQPINETTDEKKVPQNDRNNAFPVMEGTTLSPTSFNEEAASTFFGGRQPVILSGDPVGIIDEHSVVGHAYFKGESEDDGYIPPFLAEIYRTIYPWNGEGDVFKRLAQVLNETLDDSYLNPSDVFIPFLLTEDSVNLSDEELYEKLNGITETYIFSKHNGSVNYRLIAIDEDPDREMMHWMSWHYFIQVWDDDYIWAHPLCEGIEFKFDKVAFVTLPDEDEIVLLCGRTDRPSGSGFAVAGMGFIFEEGIWRPIRWEETYDEVARIKNIKINSDGIHMICYGSDMEEAFLLPPHTEPLFNLYLSEDGSFWADYSWFGSNEVVPKELLFQLKQ